MKKWHEQSDFWEAVAPVLFGQSRLSGTPAEIDRIISLANVDSSATVLDLCCGPGRHSLELARRGFTVTGVDATASYISRAKESAGQEKLKVEFVHEDMRNFIRDQAFDLVLNLYTSFGYFDDQSDNQQVLDNVYESLKSGGVFLIELAGREVIARIFQARGWREVDGNILLEERSVERNWTRMRNTWRLIKEDKRIEFSLTHWLYSGSELAAMLKQSGFSSIELFGGLEGTPYDQTAKRLVAISRK